MFLNKINVPFSIRYGFYIIIKSSAYKCILLRTYLHAVVGEVPLSRKLSKRLVVVAFYAEFLI